MFTISCRFPALILNILCKFYRKKLTDPGLFPIRLRNDELDWKLFLDYVVEEDKFLLFINDLPYLLLPFKANVSSNVPMHISGGSIKLNDDEVIRVE